MPLQYLDGALAKAYVGSVPLTANDHASVVAALALSTTKVMDNITGDLSSDESPNTQVLNTRGTAANGFESNIYGLKKGDVKFKLVWNTGAANAVAKMLHDAKEAKGEVFFAALDQVYTQSGATGPAGNYIVSGWSKGEPVEGAQTIDVSLKPSTQMSTFVAT